MFKTLFGKFFRVLGREFGFGFHQGWRGTERRSSFAKYLQARAVKTAADFFLTNMRQAWIANSKQEIWKAAIDRSELQGLVLEFGVYRGRSLTWFARNSGQDVYGFDTFSGLQEDWAGGFAKGHFALDSLPEVPGNAFLVVGRAQEQLPNFLRDNPGPIRILHLDMDTYQSTLDVLRLIRPRLEPGSVIIFDEFFGYPLWEEGEAKAWREFVDGEGISFKYFATTGIQVGVEIL